MWNQVALVLAGLCFASCAAISGDSRSSAPVHGDWVPPPNPVPSTLDLVPPTDAQSGPPPYGAPSSERRKPNWRVGQPLMQGFFGVSQYTNVSADGDNGTLDGDGGDLDQLPVLGGGGQFKLGGEKVDLGLEGIFAVSGRWDAEAFYFGGGGAAVAVDVDMLVLDLYGGPFASMFLGEKVRVYGAAGPLFQFVDYDQSGNALDADGSGFGFGWYARTGIEFALPNRVWLGVGARWSDSTVDLDGGLGDLDLEGFQFLITVSRL